MNDRIKKLLLSSDIDDVKIGWELLNLPENKPEGEEWYPYFDIFRANKLARLAETDFILQVVGEDYHRSNLWSSWSPKEVEI